MICANPKCENDFVQSTPRHKYCSHLCGSLHGYYRIREAHIATRPTPKCQVCGKPYKKVAGQKFCGNDCYQEHKRRLKRTESEYKQRVHGRQCKECPSYGRQGDCLAVLSGPSVGKPAVAVRLLDQCPRAHGLRDCLEKKLCATT